MAKVTLAAEASYSPSRPGRGRDRGREQHQAGTATTAATTGIRDVIARVEALGYEARLLETADAMGQIAGLTQRQAEETAAWLRYFLVSCCLTLPMMLVMWFAPNSALDTLHRPWQCGGACVRACLPACLRALTAVSPSCVCVCTFSPIHTIPFKI